MDKVYNILNHFLHHFITISEYLNKLNSTIGLKQFTCKRVYTFQVHKFYLVVENKHMIRVTVETKINLMTWRSINIVDIYIQEMLAEFISFLIKKL